MNPLHFEDLEPHRFEDLVRQLIYDLRQWKSLEAIGRAGGDEGIDIRAFEKMQSYDTDEIEQIDDIPPAAEATEPESRLWIIQCKRERNMGPKKIRGIVTDNLTDLVDKPYGYILVAACNFSKRARDAFREEVLSFGIEEYYLWGKGEVEDQLYLPKNDHLLFAYFGISLQIRRRSMKTNIRTKLTLKRKLTKELGDIDNPREYTSVLIRDPSDQQYPYIESTTEFVSSPHWRYWDFYGHIPPDHLAFIYRKYFAYVNWQTKEYDVLLDYDAGIRSYPEIYMLEREWYDPNKVESRYNSYWNQKIPETNRAWLLRIRIISYDRILAFDEIGDCYNEKPHLLVEYGLDGEPWEQNRGLSIFLPVGAYRTESMEEKEGKRISFFPKEIPEITPDLES